VLDERAKLPRPFLVDTCDNRDCGADLDRDAYALSDSVEGGTVIYCDVCADSALKFHPDRFRPVLIRRIPA
jgi:hypothetical protein